MLEIAPSYGGVVPRQVDDWDQAIRVACEQLTNYGGYSYNIFNDDGVHIGTVFHDGDVEDFRA